MSPIDPPGRSTRPIEPANSTSPENRIGSSGRRARTPPSRALCPGAWRTRSRGRPARPCRRRPAARTSSGSAKVSDAEQRRPDRHADARPRVGELAAVGGVDVGGDVTGLADRQHREGVVEVAVGEQHGHRVQLVLGDELVQLRDDADARVDDDALLAGTGGDHPAVRGGRVRREPGDEHGWTLQESGGRGCSGSLHGQREGYAKTIQPTEGRIAFSLPALRRRSVDCRGSSPLRQPGRYRPGDTHPLEDRSRADEQAAP